MADLTPAQAELADQALDRVRAAAAAAQAAVDDESAILVWATGSESAHAARVESLRQTRKIQAELELRRPYLSAEQLVGFVELAAAGAEVQSILDNARRMTGAGFRAEVVDPTLAELDPTNLGGFAGRATVLVVAGVVAFLLLKRA